MGSFCITQGAQAGALWQSSGLELAEKERKEGRLKRKGVCVCVCVCVYKYNYDWLALMYGRDHHSKQLPQHSKAITLQ